MERFFLDLGYAIQYKTKMEGAEDMTQQHILLIEDEVNIAKFVELELKHENFQVTVSHDGREGADLALNHAYDFMLIDVCYQI